jgi:nicotinamidase-related amidase
MSETTYPSGRTALLLVDPYNDFLSEGGKIYPRIKPIADEVGLLDNLRRLDGAIRAAGIQVVIVPHRRWEPGDCEDWDHPNPTQRAIMQRHSFARGEWVANGTRTLHRSAATSSHRSTGDKAASQIPTSISC